MVPGSETQAIAVLQTQESEMVTTFSGRSFLQGQSFVTALGEQAKLGSHVMLTSGDQVCLLPLFLGCNLDSHGGCGIVCSRKDP